MTLAPPESKPIDTAALTNSRLTLESVATNTFAEGRKPAAIARPTSKSISCVSSLPTTPRIPLVPNNLGISDLFADIIISSFDKTLYRTGSTFINSF
jgi:hypothetical protein